MGSSEIMKVSRNKLFYEASSSNFKWYDCYIGSSDPSKTIFSGDEKSLSPEVRKIENFSSTNRI